MSERNLEGRRMSRTLLVLWLAFLAAAALYLAVGFLIGRGRGTGITPPVRPELLRIVFYAVGGMMLIVAFVLRRQLMSRAYREPYAAMVGLQAAMVAGWAVSEAVGILGLVVILLGGTFLDGLPFILAAFLAIAIQRPDADELRRRLDAVD